MCYHNLTYRGWKNKHRRFKEFIKIIFVEIDPITKSFQDLACSNTFISNQLLFIYLIYLQISFLRIIFSYLHILRTINLIFIVLFTTKLIEFLKKLPNIG